MSKKMTPQHKAHGTPMNAAHMTQCCAPQKARVTRHAPPAFRALLTAKHPRHMGSDTEPDEMAGMTENGEQE